MIYSDNKDFYPTPEKLFYRLMDGERHISGRILEPSAGKGDMIRYIEKLSGRTFSREPVAYIDAIENDPRLVNSLMGEGYSVVWDDFLTYETYKEYDYIVMNPPFSNGVDHVLKAIELAENQLSDCEIYAILNKQTIDNAYSNKRQELLRKLDEYGADIEYVSEAFAAAERKTDVEVALIRASITKEGEGRKLYEAIDFGGDSSLGEQAGDSEAMETALSTYVKDSDIAERMDDIERLVIEYERACELARASFKAAAAKQSFYSYINTANKEAGEIGGPLDLIVSSDKYVRADDLNEELDRLRRGYWELILDADEFRELLTNEARQKLNRQMSEANNMEINFANIQMLMRALAANQRDILIESIVAIFEKITTYHMNDYSGNIHYYNGWKTNDAFRINKKIIIPIKHTFDAWDIGEEYARIDRQARDWIEDISKAFRLIDEEAGVESFEYIGNNSFENELLRFRMFYNGNIHVWFKRLDLLEKLNYICGSHFGWIPGEEEQKTSEEARRWVAKEFGDVGEVTLLKA